MLCVSHHRYGRKCLTCLGVTEKSETSIRSRQYCYSFRPVRHSRQEQEQFTNIFIQNSISQGCFFALGARLALYTGNQTYADWAEKTWDWMYRTQLIDNQKWGVYDGASMESNCTDITPYQFTYNAGTFILGAAAMYNRTKSDVWKQRLDNLLQATSVFFPNDKKIMVEVACEPVDRCNVDESSFKAYLSRWFGAITSWAPDTLDFVLPYLQTSAKAAASLCQGGKNGRMCGLKWNEGKYDGTTGVGPQMAALEVTLNTMAKYRPTPFTAKTGGTSQGNVNAGSEDIGRDKPADVGPLGPGNQFAGALLTIIVLGCWFAILTFMLLDETSSKTTWQQLRGVLTSAKGKTGALGAAMMGRERNNDYLSEKGNIQQPPSLSDSSSRFSNDPSVIAAAPVTIGHVRSASDNTRRRVSSMPLGWPHNTSAHSSITRQSSADNSPVVPQESNLRHATLPPNADTDDDERFVERHGDSADSISETFEEPVEQPLGQPVGNTTDELKEELGNEETGWPLVEPSAKAKKTEAHKTVEERIDEVSTGDDDDETAESAKPENRISKLSRHLGK